MKQLKFKTGDLVRCTIKDNTLFGKIGKITFVGSFKYVVDFGEPFENYVYENQIELAYPSDHDLLDFAARDSKIAELTAENEALKAELEKYKPKPESREINLCLARNEFGKIDWHIGNSAPYLWELVARKTVTITEGEGM